MIARNWYGWTSKSDADAYEELFRTQGSNVNLVEGRIGAYLLRRDLEDEVEFIVVHIFESMDVMKKIVGDDYEVARLLPGAEKLLSRYDGKCVHYEIVDAPPRT